MSTPVNSIAHGDNPSTYTKEDIHNIFRFVYIALRIRVVYHRNHVISHLTCPLSGPSSRSLKCWLHILIPLNRFSAKLQLAETICQLDPIPSDKVQILLDSCHCPSLDDLKLEKEEYYYAVSTLVVLHSISLLVTCFCACLFPHITHT